MNDQTAQTHGFVDAAELHHLIAQVNLSTPWRAAAFQKWQINDSSKAGLLQLLTANDIDPFAYDIYHLGVSGGKDSTAAMAWLIYESGWPLERVQITCCDTGNEDYYTYAYLAMLGERIYPIRYIFPERDFWELARFKKRFPSRKARFCTQWLKVIPSRDYILDLQRQGHNVLLLTGIRQAEAHNDNDRGDLPQFGWDESFAADIYRPIYHWTLDDVWTAHRRYLELDDVLMMIREDPYLDEAADLYWQEYYIRRDFRQELLDAFQAHQIPRNPLYDLGANRVGCFPCINSCKAEIRAMATYRPQRIDFLEKMEASTGQESNVGYSSFFARKTVPLPHRSKTITTTKGEQMRVATIRDVVRWSKTAYGGKKFDLINFGNGGLACNFGGLCE